MTNVQYVTDVRNPLPVRTFAFLQILSGLGLVIADAILASVSFVSEAFTYSILMSGLFLGVFCFVTGCSGMATVRPSPDGSPSPRRCLLIATMLMSIISFVGALAMIVLSAVVLVFVHSAKTDSDSSHRCSDGNDLHKWCVGDRNLYMIIGCVFYGAIVVVSVAQTVATGGNLPRTSSNPVGGQVVPMKSVYHGMPGVPYSRKQSEPFGLPHFVPEKVAIAPQLEYTPDMPTTSEASRRSTLY